MRVLLPLPALFTALLLMVSASVAQPEEQQLNPYLLLSNAQQVAEVVDAAQEEILLNAVALQQRPVAEALRVAMVERGIPVYILTTPSGANERASFLHSLFLAGASVRISNVEEPFLLVDRSRAVVGPLIARAGLQGLEQESDDGTFLISDERQVSRFAQAFVEAFQQATRFDYRPSP